MVIATIIGLLALFSLITILVSSEDPRDTERYRKTDLPLWVRYGHR